MFKNIHFFGGIHASGKGTLSKEICSYVPLIHITASEVIKWKDISADKDKNVEDIGFTQNILISNLQKIIDMEKSYLLDGHYCLLDMDDNIVRVDEEIFRKINPKSFSIKLDEITEIQKRLELRDLKSYNIDFLEKFQLQEFDYANYLSKKFNKPLFVLSNDINAYINYLKI